MKSVLIVHHCDNDGYGAAAIIAHAIGKDKVDYIEASYEVPLKKLIKNTNYRTIYFVDYSISTKENALFIMKLNKERDVIWIDHHKSSIDMIEEMPELSDLYGYRVIGISGTGLSWIYALNHLALDREGVTDLVLNNATSKIDQIQDTYTPISTLMGGSILRQLMIPTTLHLINRWDIWDIDDRVLDFKYGLDISGPIDLLGVLESDEIDFRTQSKAIHDGVVIRRHVEKEDKENCDKNGFEIKIQYENNTYSCFCLNTNHFSSLAFGDRVNDYDIVMPFNYNGRKWRYSMYTVKTGVDCSRIAKRFAGGGHPQAAGFTTDNLVVNPGETLVAAASKHGRV